MDSNAIVTGQARSEKRPGDREPVRPNVDIDCTFWRILMDVFVEDDTVAD